MERSHCLIAILIFLSSLTALKAGEKPEIYDAYIHNNMAKWKTVLVRMESEKRTDSEYMLELVNYQYGYIAWCIGNKRHDEARLYLRKAEALVDLLERDPSNSSKVNSYRSAFYGYKIGLNRFIAPVAGLSSINCANAAVEADKNDPFGYVQCGNIQFYMPQVFGGSKKKALAYFLQARKLMENDQVKIRDDWNYLSLLVIIAQSYSYLEDYKSSVACMDEILRIAPDFAWIRNELYPEVLKKMKK